MEQENILKEILENIENKNFKMYFFTMDTMGNPSAGVANIYQHVKLLNQNGFDAVILHEKNDYSGVESWLGKEYNSLPHTSIESELSIKPEDFMFIPEIFSNIMHDVRTFNCKKVVFSQNYHYILELLAPGAKWTDYGFTDAITTSKQQATFIKTLFPQISTSVVPLSIPSYFEESDKPSKPVIGIMTREQGDALKIAKSFYLQYPLYKWVSFKEFRNYSREDFATELKECCLTVWVDDVAGHGTFPLESLECGVPVIAKVPNLIQDWMGTEVVDEETGMKSWFINDNFLWTKDYLDIPKLISDYLNLYLTDELPQQLFDNMESAKGKFSVENQEKILLEVYGNLINKRKGEIEIMVERENNKEKENN